MAIYKVEVRELSKVIVSVEAETAEEAQAALEKDYWKDPNAYCLEPDDTEFEVIGKVNV